MTTHQANFATFGAGCFWGVQASFDALDGVLETIVGYAGGHTQNPTYEQVCKHNTGHAEVIQIKFDPTILSYETLLNHFFKIHNPTTLNQQGPDIGSQYRSIILYHSAEQATAANQYIKKLTEEAYYEAPIVTEIVEAGPFYPAEAYHQKYLAKHGKSGCQLPD